MIIQEDLLKVIYFNLCFRIKVYSGIHLNRQIMFSYIWVVFSCKQKCLIVNIEHWLDFRSFRKSILVLFFSICAFIHALFQGLDCICQWSWFPLLSEVAKRVFQSILFLGWEYTGTLSQAVYICFVFINRRYWYADAPPPNKGNW